MKAFRGANEIVSCDGLAYYLCFAQLAMPSLFVAKLPHYLICVLAESLRPVPGLKRRPGKLDYRADLPGLPMVDEAL